MEDEARNETDGVQSGEAKPAESSSTKPEEAAAAGEKPAEGASGGSSTPGAQGIDYAKLPHRALHVLRDPAAALGTARTPGSAAFLEGIIFGGAVAIVLPLVQLLVVKILWGSAAPVSFGDLVRAWIGGILFLATAAVVSFFLRPGGGSSPKDIKDDAYLAGTSMLFLLAGALVAGFFMLFKSQFFATLARTASLSGLLLAAMTFYFGIRSTLAVDSRRAFWMVPAVFAAALIVAGQLNFHPVQTTLQFNFDYGAAQRTIQQGLEDAMRSMGR